MIEIRVDDSDVQMALTRALRGLPRAVRQAEAGSARIVARRAQARVPHGPAVGGHAASSIRSIGPEVRGGGPRYPYYPWLEFGGRVGPQGSVRRRWVQGGRYIYPSMVDSTRAIESEMLDQLNDVFDGFRGRL